MSQIITWLIAGSALAVSIYSVYRTQVVSQAQLSLPARLRDQALRDTMRADLSEALLDLESFTRTRKSGENPQIPSSILALERSGVSRAQPLGPKVESDLRLCCVHLKGISVQIQIEQGEEVSYNLKREELESARLYAEGDSQVLKPFEEDAEKAKDRLIARRARILVVSQSAQAELGRIIKEFDYFATEHFPVSS